jgi:hypothetical protein
LEISALSHQHVPLSKMLVPAESHSGQACGTFSRVMRKYCPATVTCFPPWHIRQIGEGLIRRFAALYLDLLIPGVLAWTKVARILRAADQRS